ncbi:hypothetical protein GCM10022234_20610 [Aeromicrobium panaciterrae]|uniref:hypothetical protein n=1 Tax=Aeromicrobium panaciterrae TaxID=363861 RepID=UPI0031DCA03B
MKIKAGGEQASRAERVGVASSALILVVWALWRTQFGADRGDGAHSVVMAIRLADGAVPFVDEMNAQATGSFLAVPFTWLWVHVVGLDGIVLASRLFFVALSAAACYIAYRALRPSFRPWVAFTIPAAALVPTSFNLMLVNYTTAPSITLVVATAAAHAAIVRHSGRWAAVSGASAAIAGFSHPAAIPPAALLLVICFVVARDRRVRLLLSVGAAAVVLVAFAWLVVVVGVSNVRDTLTYTSDYQAVRPHPVERIKVFLRTFENGLVSWRYLPMWILAVMALVPRIGERVRATLLVAVVVAAAVPSLLLSGATDLPPFPFGRYSGVYATIVMIVLLVPVAVEGFRSRDGHVRTLLVLALPPALLSLPVTAAVSSASPLWGVAVLGLAPAFGAIVAMPAILAPHRTQAVAACFVGVSLVAAMGVQTLFSFRDPAPWNTTTRITAGAYAGIRTTSEHATLAETERRVIRRWSGPDDSVFAYGSVSAYLYVRGRIDTNIIWMPTDGPSTQFTIDFFERTDDFPDVVFISEGGTRVADLGEQQWRADQPLVDYFYAHYDKVDIGEHYLIFRKRANG